jgi:hypothetical protein
MTRTKRTIKQPRKISDTYTIMEISRLTGIERRRVARILKSNDVGYTFSGRRKIFSTMDIIVKIPHIWNIISQKYNVNLVP